MTGRSNCGTARSANKQPRSALSQHSKQRYDCSPSSSSLLFSARLFSLFLSIPSFLTHSLSHPLTHCCLLVPSPSLPFIPVLCLVSFFYFSSFQSWTSGLTVCDSSHSVACSFGDGSLHVFRAEYAVRPDGSMQ